jgi:hypothetical protein
LKRKASREEKRREEKVKKTVGALSAEQVPRSSEIHGNSETLGDGKDDESEVVKK